MASLQNRQKGYEKKVMLWDVEVILEIKKMTIWEQMQIQKKYPNIWVEWWQDSVEAWIEMITSCIKSRWFDEPVTKENLMLLTDEEFNKIANEINPTIEKKN